LPKETQDAFIEAMRRFFHMPLEQKLLLKRTETNSRGFAHDELTKQLKVSGRTYLTCAGNGAKNVCLGLDRCKLLFERVQWFVVNVLCTKNSSLWRAGVRFSSLIVITPA
jgi:hypothetical protein